MNPTRLPWYDSYWLTSYIRVRDYLAQQKPQQLAGFVDALRPLRTSPDFRLKLVPDLFDGSTRERLRQLVATLQLSELEQHELFNFGRLIVHDHPMLTELQATLTDRMGEWVGEAVEPSYNFLSLYNNLGVCDPHMDAPSAKWTLDYCIAQSEPWPIHFSEVVPWPEDWQHGDDAGWRERLKQDKSLQFTTYVLQENEALVFGGSSQWHYRNRIARHHKQNYCQLVFLHYVPRGTGELVEPENWARLFGIAELDSLIVHRRGYTATIPNCR